jgi:hypothetical protein
MATDHLTDPVLTVVPIDGVPSSLGNDPTSLEAAADRIEAVTDQQVVEAVARIPLGDPWKSPASRRLEIANWLAYRRSKVREVIATWA